jgi:predicted P-loop ATPase
MADDKTPPDGNDGKPMEKKKIVKLADEAYRRSVKKRKPPIGFPAELYDRLDPGREGPKASAHNLALVLMEHPEWHGVFALDDFAQTIVMQREPPCIATQGELHREHITEIAIWMSNPLHAGIVANDDLIKRVVMALAARARFHVVRAYLDQIAWDGQDRIERLFADKCGADHSEYAAQVARMLLVSAVARVYAPGCRVNFMLILEGHQQIGKSWFIKILFGDAWSCEAMESPTHKDFYQCLIGQWAVEVAEMQSFNKADVNKVKQAISQPSDVYRKSYDDRARRWPRQGIFVGTTNQFSDYLSDETGATRFLPIRVTGIETERLADDRDQLWAQAVQLYRDGFRYWELPAQAQEEQEKRYRVDSWEEAITRWLEGKAPDVFYPPERGQETGLARQISVATTTELMKFALGIDLGKHTPQDQARVGRIMRRLGWEKTRPRIEEGERQYAFQRPHKAVGP